MAKVHRDQRKLLHDAAAFAGRIGPSLLQDTGHTQLAQHGQQASTACLLRFWYRRRAAALLLLFRRVLLGWPPSPNFEAVCTGGRRNTSDHERGRDRGTTPGNRCSESDCSKPFCTGISACDFSASIQQLSSRRATAESTDWEQTKQPTARQPTCNQPTIGRYTSSIFEPSRGPARQPKFAKRCSLRFFDDTEDQSK